MDHSEEERLPAEDDDSSILYDLFVPVEWSVEPEPLTNVILEKPQSSLVTKVSSAAIRTGWTILRSTGIPLRSSTICSLPVSLIKLINAQINWHIAVDKSGKLLAILQDNCIEIRSFRDEFVSIIGKCPVPKDSHPQWRKLAWSPDSSMLACSSSRGTIRAFDPVGSLLFTIERPGQIAPDAPVDFSCAVAALIFTDNRHATKWSAELLVITYQGALCSYLVSPSDGFQDSHTFLFSGHYPRGISCADYDSQHSLLFIGGLSEQQSNENQDKVVMATKEGLTAWRVLSVPPYYKLVTDYDREYGQGKSLFKRISRISNVGNYFLQSQEQDGVFKMCFKEKVLLTIHQSGLLGVWDVPSMRRRKAWPIDQQPGFNETKANVILPAKRKKPTDAPMDALAEVNFWSEESIVLARFSGTVAVCTISDLKNRLGESCEWLESAPRLTRKLGKGFLALECETQAMVPKQRHLSSESMDSSNGLDFTMDNDSDDDEDEEASYLSRSTGYMRQALHFITDSERFQPPRKKPKVMRHTYRLVSLQKTTPEELYNRRIQDEEYGEALEIAKRFNLDTDLVYQTQWKKHPVSMATIQDYLSKITKRSWVLHECLERVPEDIDAARELLTYGLTGTDVEALIKIGRREDQGRFITSMDYDTDDTLDESDDWSGSYDQTKQDVANERRRQIQAQLLNDVDLDDLTLQQKELIRSRLRLLTYLDRLKTFEEIHGGDEMAARQYKEEAYEKFRSQNILELAIEFARDSMWKELDTLLTYHGKELLPHWLIILNNFPETTPPSEYKELLPEASTGGDVKGWEQYSHRKEDWCESPQVLDIVYPARSDPGEWFYAEFSHMLPFRVDRLKKSKLTKWYTFRAREIERESHQVDSALELITLAVARNIPNLIPLQDDLKTLEVLIYEADADPNLTLEILEKKSDLEKIQLMMQKSSEEMYIKNLVRWVLPFLERCEKKNCGIQSELLSQYILSTAKENLTHCKMIFEKSKPGLPNPIIPDEQEMMSLAMECIYACEEPNQLSIQLAIQELLPYKGLGIISGHMEALHHEVDKLRCHLKAAEILAGRDVWKTPKMIRDSQTDKEQAHGLIVQLTRQAAKKDPPMTKFDWHKLLEDCLSLQASVYGCLTPAECLEIYTESLLGSCSKENIQLAGEYVTTSKRDPQRNVMRPKREKTLANTLQRRNTTTCSPSSEMNLPRVDYERSVKLVLTAAQEYFNSSARLKDLTMDLARACLTLIKDSSHLIQEELDLIESLSLLNEFHTKVLPLEVRLCQERLQLVKKALNSHSTAYKTTSKLQELAKLLRVLGTNSKERIGQVNMLIAEAALKANDIYISEELCMQLIKDEYSPGWRVCKQLAEIKTFTKLTVKQNLLAFALCHCEADEFSNIFALRTANEMEILCDSLGITTDKEEDFQDAEENQMGGDQEDFESPMEEGVAQDDTDKGMLRSALGKTTATTRHVLAATGATTQQVLAMTGATTRHVLASTGATTKAIFGAVSDKNFWSDTLKWVRPLSQAKMKDIKVEMESSGGIVAEHWCHPFYETVIRNAKASNIYPSYSTIRWTPSDSSPIHTNQSLLTLSQLAELQGTGEAAETAKQYITNILLDLALQSMTSDLTLALCYLLALPNPLDAEQFFAKIPRCAMTLQLGSYLYALHISIRLNQERESTYATPPAILIDQVLKQMTNMESSDWSDEVQALGEKFQLYLDLLDDFVQAQTLQSLGRGVDVARFTQDNDYKEETILGLAMCLEDGVYELSVSLAHKYKISVWELYMSHVEFLFSDSGLQTSKIEERIKKLDILPTLLEQPAAFLKRMKEGIYPLIEGSDHSSLLYYYSLLQGCSSEFGDEDHTPEAHMKFLKKLKAAVPRLDYKSLMDGVRDPRDVLSPVLNSANVHVVAKMAGKISDKNGGNLTASQVFGTFVVKLFWQGDQGVKKNPESVADWLHRYEACGDYFNKITPQEFVEVILKIVYSEESLKKLELECRQNLITRALKYIRSKGGNKQKFVSGFTEEDTELAIKKLQQFQKHLQVVTQEPVQELKKSDETNGSLFYKKYDLTSGEVDQLQAVISDLLCEGTSLELINSLIQLKNVGEWNLKVALKENLARIADALRNSSNDAVVIENSMKTLRILVRSVNKHIEQSGSSVSHTDVLDVLTPLCNDSTVAVQPRVELLQLLEETFDLEEADSTQLLLFKTNAIVKEAWNRKVSIKKIVNEKSRQKLFFDLLESSMAYSQLTALSGLLFQWPQFSKKGGGGESHQWHTLLLAMLHHSEFKGYIDCFVVVVSNPVCNSSLTAENVRSLYAELTKLNEQLCAWKVVLLCQHPSLYQTVVEDLRQISEASDITHDAQLYDLLITNRLSAQVVQTVFYPHLIQHLFKIAEDQGAGTSIVEDTASQLFQADFKAEAATLLMQNRGTHPLLQTLDTAYSVVSNWFKR